MTSLPLRFLSLTRAAAVAVLTLLLGFVAVAVAQQAAGPRDGAVVRSIEIRYAGNVTVSRERILSNMRTTVGQPFSQQGIEEDIRNLYQTGDVTNVRIFGEPAGNGVKVIVIVQGRAIIKEIVIEGARLVPAKRLAKGLKAKEGGALSEDQLEVDRQSIIEIYQNKGYNDIDVQYKVSRDERAGNAVVYFAINEGGKSVLDKIRIEGNQFVSTRAIRKAMKNTKPKTFLQFITKDGRLDQNKLREDLDGVREVYQNKGYIDMEVKQTRTERDANGKVTLVIVISEGPLYKVAKLAFSGNKAITDTDFRRFIKMKEQSLYTAKGLKDDVKTLSDFYGARGYVDATVQPVAEPAGPGLVSLTYRFTEGEISYVERINIEGNSITKDKVVRRELALAPGDIYSTVYADASKRRLENLNFFSKVEITPGDTLVPGRKDMNVILEEKRTGELSFGLGFSSVDKLVGQATLSQGNFDITNYPAFTGAGQKFRLNAVYGTTRKDFTATFVEPYVFDSRFSLTLEGFYHDTNYTNNDYRQRNLGATVGVRRPVPYLPYTSGRLEYSIQDIKVSQISDPTSVLSGEAGSATRSAVTLGFNFDNRDNLFLTRRGTRADLSFYTAGGVLGGSTKIYGWNFDFAHYILLPYDFIWTIQGQIAGVAPLSGGEVTSDPAYARYSRTTSRRVPIYDRLFLGGGNNLRGFDYRDVGPRDSLNQPLGGRSLGRVTTEVTFPIIERVRGAVFYDGGVNHRQSFAYGMSRYASDAGIGVRLDLPVGPIRLDYGVPITREDSSQKKSGKFNFNVGYQF